MKKYIKQNKLVIISFIILLLWGGGSIFFWKENTYNNDPIILYYDIISTYLYSIQNIAPLFIIIPIIYQFHQELHTGYIKNCLTRTSYNKYMLKNYLKNISKSMILPLFVILLMIFCCIKLNSTSFGSGADMYNHYASPEIEYGYKIGRFMLTYIVVIAIDSIFYVNLGLIYCRKKLSYAVTVVLSYLTFIGLEFMGECIIGGIILARLLDIHYTQDYFNLFNIWIYDGIHNLGLFLLYHLFLLISSTLIVYLLYRKKEGVLIECEK